MTRRRACAALAAGTLALSAPAAEARKVGRPKVAAVQVALRAHGLYSGTIDGHRGPLTAAGIRAFQRRRGLVVDGVVGPVTRRALGRRGRPRLGRRVIRLGAAGFDVAALQFRLAWRGFPSGPIDGGYGPRTSAAVQRFQGWAGLAVDGVTGPATIRAARRRVRRSPVSLAPPASGPIGDRFGPRGDRFHTGLDYPVAHGTTVRAARRGRVVSAGYDHGGFGNLVVIAHGRGVSTAYAHLAGIGVGRGARVARGTRVGAVGSTGFSTGPHLHFELRLRGAAIDPLTGLRR